jgi:SAM-dependent methyltransferase
MADSDTEFEGSIPGIYDQYLAPVIFEPYAIDLAERCSDLIGGELLETAAGTGVVTRALDRMLPVSVAIVATDLKSAMLAYAAARTERESTRPEGRIAWQQADALALPFEDGRFDAVVCQFGVMFFPKKVEAYQETRRVLKPGGRFVFNVWDRIETSEFADVVSAAVASRFPDDPPDFLRRVPHGYHNTDRIVDELGAAAFSHVVVESIELPTRANSPRDPAIGFCQGTPLRMEIEARDPSRLVAVTEAATAAISARFGGGIVEGRSRAYVITAIR